MTSSTTVQYETIEERIERIRKRDEELEKKHRMAEEDRLIAKMKNALVEPKKSYNPEEWPLEHKFDKLDITYDVPETKLNPELAPQMKVKRPARHKTEFKEGEGPPPDPNSFLFDEERDGPEKIKSAESTRRKGNDQKGRKWKPQQLSQHQQQQHEDASDDDLKGRMNGNITVSVSQNGEVKSVKLTQAPTFGSGRVGPRYVKPGNQQQFQQPGGPPTPLQQKVEFRPRVEHQRGGPMMPTHPTGPPPPLPPMRVYPNPPPQPQVPQFYTRAAMQPPTETPIAMYRNGIGRYQHHQALPMSQPPPPPPRQSTIIKTVSVQDRLRRNQHPQEAFVNR